MTSPANKNMQGLAWPQNGAAWVEHEMLYGPEDLGVQYALVDRSHTSSDAETEWRLTLGAEAVKLERREGAVAHLPREIAYDEFTDVVLWGALAHNEAADVMVGLSLYSAAHDLQVPVCIKVDVECLASYWTAWSQALGIQPKVLDDDHFLRDPFGGMGRLMQGSAQPRRLPSRRLDRGAWMPSSAWRRDAAATAQPL